MKKILLGMFAFAMLFATSCESGLDEVATVDQTSTVSFQISTPQIATRAYSDGETATKLQYAVYAEDGTYLDGLTGAKDIFKTASVKMDLVTGNKYKVVFWAAAEGAPYEVDFENKVMEVDYTGVTCNNENLDAFYACKEITVSGVQTETVELKRPFAQINVGTSDYTTAATAGLVPTQSKFVVKNVYTTLNLLDGTVDDSAPVTFDWANIKKDETFPVEGYKYVAMNYVLVDAEQELVEVEFYYRAGVGAAKEYDRTVGSVPVKRNYRTNIYGKLITSAVDINIEIKPGYDGVFDNEGYFVETDANGNTTAIVESAAGLATIAEAIADGTISSDSNIVLEGDIDLADLAAMTRAAVVSNWNPIGTSEEPFTGTFDGKGYTIKNLTLVEDEAIEGKVHSGFFGYAKDATIKNVTFENVYINIPCLDIDHSQGHIGAVAGTLEGTSLVENVTVKGDIKVEATPTANGASRVAVVAGGNSSGNVTMKNVHVIANEGSYLKANNNVGALAGQLQGKSVFENCSSNIDVTGTKFFAGGIIGLAAGDQLFTNCHTTGDITITAGRAGRVHDHYRVGGIAGGWADGAKNVCTLNGCTYTGNISGTNADGSVAETLDYAGYVGRGYTLNGCQGSKVVIDGYGYVQAGNTAAEAGVYNYEVGTVEALKAFAAKVNDGDTFEGKTVKLAADIDLNNEQWTPIGYWETFNGTFDGQGHTISNLKHIGTEADCYVGLFGYVENATIKNLTVNNADIKLVANASWAGGHIGAVVGNAKGNCVFENINVVGDVKIEGDIAKAGAGRIGGVIGGNEVYATIKNVHVNANVGSYVKGNSSIGGIAGQLQGVMTFEDCSSNIDVIAGQFGAGGIIGLASHNCSFTNCEASGNISVVAGRANNNNDLYRVGAIAGSWDDNVDYPLVLTGCSHNAILSGASADGRTATGFDCAGFVGRGYSAVVDAVVLVNGDEYKYAGNGSYSGVETVNTAAALKAALESLTAGEMVVLESDIDLTGENWEVSMPWQGSATDVVFNGNGHKIIGLTTNGLYGGLFGKYNSNGNITIKNLTLENVSITGTNVDGECAGGALIGWIENHGAGTITIENVNVVGIKAEGFKYTGGLIGYNNGNVAMNLVGCSVTGASDSYLNSTYNEKGNYKGHVGGLLGLWMKGSLTNCEVKDLTIKHGTTDMSGSSNRAGALVGTKYAGVEVVSATVDNVTVDGVAASATSLFGVASTASEADKANVTIK